MIPQLRQPLLEDFLKHLGERRYSGNSIQNHRRDVQRFLSWIGEGEEVPLARLQSLNPVDIEDYVVVLWQVYRARSVARHLSSLKMFLNDLELRGLIRVNPLHGVRFPEIVPTPPQSLTHEEVITLLESPDPKHYLGLRDRALLELMYSSGLKVKELLALDVNDLYLSLCFLKVRGKRERMVPVTTKAVEALEEYLSRSREVRLLNKSDPCLFPGRNGTRMSRMGFWAMIRKQAKRAGIQNPINGRILRHSFAIHLLQNGMDLPDIQDLFGYVSLDATLQYSHINRPNYMEVYHKYHPLGQNREKVSKALDESNEKA